MWTSGLLKRVQHQVRSLKALLNPLWSQAVQLPPLWEELHAWVVPSRTYVRSHKDQTICLWDKWLWGIFPIKGKTLPALNESPRIQKEGVPCFRSKETWWPEQDCGQSVIELLNISKSSLPFIRRNICPDYPNEFSPPTTWRLLHVLVNLFPACLEHLTTLLTPKVDYFCDLRLQTKYTTIHYWRESTSFLMRVLIS